MSLLSMSQVDLDNHTIKYWISAGYLKGNMVESETKVFDGHYQVPLPF